MLGFPPMEKLAEPTKVDQASNLQKGAFFAIATLVDQPGAMISWITDFKERILGID